MEFPGVSQYGEMLPQMKKFKFILLIFITFQLTQSICLTAAVPQKKEILIFTSGGTHGYYHRTANDILKYLEGSLESTEIINMITTGSIENLARLKTGMADIAILQRDVALEAYYQMQNPFKKFEILMPLFPESLQIFTYGEPEVISFSEFLRKVKAGDIKKMAIGPPKSTSNITSRRILNLFGLNKPENFFDERLLTHPIDDLKNGEVHALALMMAAPVPRFSNKTNEVQKISLVSMSKADVRHIISHISTLDEIQFSSDIYPFLPFPPVTVRCVGTWAFLVASTGAIDEIRLKGNMTFNGVILKKLLETVRSTPFYNTFKKNGYFEFTFDGITHSIKPKSGNYSYFFRGLPLSEEFESFLPASGNSTFTSLFLLALIGTIFFPFYKLYRKIDIYKYWLRYTWKILRKQGNKKTSIFQTKALPLLSAVAAIFLFIGKPVPLYEISILNTKHFHCWISGRGRGWRFFQLSPGISTAWISWNLPPLPWINSKRTWMNGERLTKPTMPTYSNSLKITPGTGTSWKPLSASSRLIRPNGPVY